MSALKGRLLVATPNLGDPNFERTVVLVLEHGDEGALGVVLNRPSELDVAEPLPEWARAAAHPPVVFIGGPVAPSAAVCLARLGRHGGAEGWQPLLGQDGLVGTLDLDSDPDEAIPRIDEIRSSPATPDGARASSRARSPRAAGSSSTPSRATRSRRRRKASGRRCSGASGAPSPCSRRTRPTRR